jgi:hypothetical protein
VLGTAIGIADGSAPGFGESGGGQKGEGNSELLHNYSFGKYTASKSAVDGKSGQAPGVDAERMVA